jgi:hypothetical protein
MIIRSVAAALSAASCAGTGSDSGEEGRSSGVFGAVESEGAVDVAIGTGATGRLCSDGLASAAITGAAADAGAAGLAKGAAAAFAGRAFTGDGAVAVAEGEGLDAGVRVAHQTMTANKPAIAPAIARRREDCEVMEA